MTWIACWLAPSVILLGYFGITCWWTYHRPRVYTKPGYRWDGR